MGPGTAQKMLDHLIEVTSDFPEAWPALLPTLCRLSDIVDDAAIAECGQSALGIEEDNQPSEEKP